MDAIGRRSLRMQCVGVLVCVLIILSFAAFWMLAPSVSDSGREGGMVRIAPPGDEASSSVVPSPSVALSALHGFELHGISTSPEARALIAEHGSSPHWVRRGEVVRDTVVLALVSRGHIVLADGATQLRIDLPQRLGGSGDPVPTVLQGLRPAPLPPSGERSAAEMAAQAGDQGSRSETPTPEEQEAARRNELPQLAS